MCPTRQWRRPPRPTGRSPTASSPPSARRRCPIAGGISTTIPGSTPISRRRWRRTPICAPPMPICAARPMRSATRRRNGRSALRSRGRSNRRMPAASTHSICPVRAMRWANRSPIRSILPGGSGARSNRRRRMRKPSRRCVTRSASPSRHRWHATMSASVRRTARSRRPSMSSRSSIRRSLRSPGCSTAGAGPPST